MAAEANIKGLKEQVKGESSRLFKKANPAWHCEGYFYKKKDTNNPHVGLQGSNRGGGNLEVQFRRIEVN